LLKVNRQCRLARASFAFDSRRISAGAGSGAAATEGEYREKYRYRQRLHGLDTQVYEDYLVLLIFEPYAAHLSKPVAAGTGVMTRALASIEARGLDAQRVDARDTSWLNEAADTAAAALKRQSGPALWTQRFKRTLLLSKRECRGRFTDTFNFA
jgi:hypothetical protein